ncbi:MAG: hypothetical protein MR510_02525 [Clostridium sp.]|uniref:hypothetical protein n=1 Tax=Clostridium sp. TaxID=1506 RepID=UPI0025C72A02|nr:hypothetical protein [Clostridium sp.]MCI6691356.1 hypothetical protein [Clostridium sp.]MDY2630426.1 hypothetical protein [Clostridium sp.]
MLYSTVLSSKDITKLVNLKGKDKGIEITHIEIDNEINFSGKIFNKINSKFSGSLYIKSFYNNKIVIGTKDISIDKLGMLKGISNVVLKSVIKIIGEDQLIIKGKDIIIDLNKYEANIEDVYIKDKLLYIIGSKLELYINA